jgi:type III pantothenate kinase
MYLVIDRGNTRMKTALFMEGNDPEISVLEPGSPVQVDTLLNEAEERYGQGSIVRGIFSSVVSDNEAIVRSIGKRMNLLVLSGETPLPVRNRYATPGTLGNDRIAAAVAAHALFPGHHVLTIDAGTCITYDFIHADGDYLGGGISPGIGIRFSAMHTFTSKLPLVSVDGDADLIGRTTEGSMRSGVLNGTLAEVDGIIDRYRASYPGLKIILTGGDANYFDNKLKNNIFAVPNLVLMGLKDILRYNAEK